MPSIVKICINLLVSVLMMPLYIYVQQALMNLNTEMSNDASKVIQEIKVVKALQYEYQQMFESLQEGILVVTDGAISFKNSIYDKIC